MEEDQVTIPDMDASYPVLTIPKNLALERTHGYECIKVNITSEDEEGNEMNIYSGLCKIEILDCDVDHDDPRNSSDSDNVECEVTIQDPQEDNGSEMSTHNTYVNDNYNGMETEEESNSVYQCHIAEITVSQQTMSSMVRHNEVQYSAQMHQELGRVQMTVAEANTQTVYRNLNEEELECGLFLSQLPEIIIASENRARRSMEYIDPQSESLNQGHNENNEVQEIIANEKNIDSQSDNDAITQLMSSKLQKKSTQHRTIMYVGGSSPQEHHTIECIAVNDPQIKCVRNGDVNNIGESHKKKYQCEKCKQIFYKLATFKRHMDIHQPEVRKTVDRPVEEPLVFECPQCKKSLKTRKKFELHCSGHGNPDRECDKCHKIFSSKMSLKTHTKIHQRTHKCQFCKKSYQQAKELHEHLNKMHWVIQCNKCESLTAKSMFAEHMEKHKLSEMKTTDSEVAVSNDGLPDGKNDSVTVSNDGLPDGKDDSVAVSNDGLPDGKDDSIDSERKEEHEDIIDQVVNNELFQVHSKTAKNKKKICNICLKAFDRTCDLKRHLIEHIVRSTLAKCPVDDSGALNIRCAVCKAQTFHKMDRYKAHLRDHAKLTTFKCNSCDKTFSNSSNFSKHKKTHGSKFFLCDSCQRKFTSKKSLNEHMRYHEGNELYKCDYCDKVFHFKHLKDKHIKSHTRTHLISYKCGFCSDIFNSLKEKWQHEWLKHNYRKIIVDCLICGSKFRKYCELKVHFKAYHNIKIPTVRVLKETQDPLMKL